MSLKEQQDLLAKLYTDADTRRRFETDPAGVAAEFAVSGPERADLAAIAVDEVRFFADSLFLKRFREVKKLLPISSRSVESRFQDLFQGFSGEFTPISDKKHIEDALQFSAFLLGNPGLGELTKDVLRFESVRLRHNTQDRRFSAVLLKHDLRPMLGGAGDALPGRRRIALWFRIGKTPRFLFI